MIHQLLPRRMYWKAQGYHAFPLTERDQLGDSASFPAWHVYASLLERAKQGKFDEIRDLIGWHEHSDDWVLRRAYVKLLGDAGTAAVLRELLENLFPRVLVHDRYDYAEALLNWGNLSVVPALVDLYAENYEFEDAKFIPARLSQLLEEEPGPVSKFPRKGPADVVKSYHLLVMDRYEELKQSLGTDNTNVFRGRKLHIVPIAEHMLNDLSKKRFDEEMRHKFEAMTGINCNCFYKNSKIQPLAAAAIIEKFLEGPEPSKYSEDIRYFFGHRVTSVSKLEL